MSEQYFTDDGRFYLRMLTADDVTASYEAWFRNPDVTEFLDSRNVTMAESQEYIRNGHESRSFFMYGIFDSSNNVHVGNVKIGPINWAHGTSDLVTIVGDTRYWGKGVATAAIKAGNQVAFSKYGLRKLSGGIARGNTGSIKAYTRAGWVIEAVMIGHHLINGEPRDRIVVSCFNPAHFPDMPKGLDMSAEAL